MIQNLLARLMLALLLMSPALALVPAAAEAATPSTSVQKTGSFDASSLTVNSGQKARLTGTTTASKIRLTIASGTGVVLYRNTSVGIHGGTWQASVSKKLADGTYTASIYQDVKGKFKLLDRSQLQVGANPVVTTTTVSVAPVAPIVPTAPVVPSVTVSAEPDMLKVLPVALLGGGTTKGGATVPISYLQIINQSNASTTLAGFWIQEDGTAPVTSIIGFSSVDDKGNNRMSVGGTEGQTPFVNGKAFVPSGAVLAPHQMKLFTIKAQLSATASTYAGTSLMLNVSGVDAKATSTTAFPVRGTTWVIQ